MNERTKKPIFGGSLDIYTLGYRPKGTDDKVSFSRALFWFGNGIRDSSVCVSG